MKSYPSLKQQTYLTQLLRVKNQGVAYLDGSTSSLAHKAAGELWAKGCRHLYAV